MKRLAALVTGLWCALVAPLWAEPVRYVLDVPNSTVGFEVLFGQDQITGLFPVRSADISLDLTNTANSRIAVVMDTVSARASFPFATQAMRGPKVLATAQYPEMIFQSDSLRADGERAKVSGILTLRGQSRPISLDAQVFRQKGTEAGDLSRLSVFLTGSLNRSDFGATGWNDMVSDKVVLKILIRIDRAG